MTEPIDTLDSGKLSVHHDFVWLLHRNGLDTFESFYDERLGKRLRDTGLRENLRLTLDTSRGPFTFFLKRHEPLRLGEKLFSWVGLGRRVNPAQVEMKNIDRLRQLGILTMQFVALGEDEVSGRSFLMTAEIDGALPADDLARLRFGSRDRETVRARRRFVRALGELVRKLHSARLTHRDLYLCHVFVREVEQDFQLRLIDLQRVARSFLRRWKVKDIAQLEYSRPPGTFSRTDGVRFLHAYFQTHRLGRREKLFTADVLSKAERMRRKNPPREVCQ